MNRAPTSENRENRAIAVCVDDFGHHAGVDEAVLSLAARRRISATSCMVGGPTWKSGALALRSLPATQLDAGLHLDLTEHPFDRSLRQSLAAWMVRSAARAVPRPALQKEITRQLDAFEDAMGRPPAHVDGHQHVHQFPVVRDVLVAALEARPAAHRPWIRRTRRVQGMPFGGKTRVIDAMGEAPTARLAAAHGFRQNERLVGVYDFKGGREAYETLLRRWLLGAGPADLLMCHPAAAGAAGDPIAAARAAEFEALASDRYDDLLQECGVSIAPMSTLLQN